jgi:hypothetical protein
LNIPHDVKLQLSDISHLKYWEMSNVLPYTAVAILRVNMYWLVDLGLLMWGMEWAEHWM